MVIIIISTLFTTNLLCYYFYIIFISNYTNIPKSQRYYILNNTFVIVII